MIDFWGQLPFRSVHSHFLTVCTAVFPNMYSEKRGGGESWRRRRKRQGEKDLQEDLFNNGTNPTIRASHHIKYLHTFDKT